jgi:hypothetical protein
LKVSNRRRHEGSGRRHFPTPADAPAVAPAFRRSFLAAAGSSAAVGFAGCLGSRTGREPVPAVRPVDAADYRDTPHGSAGFLPESPSQPFAGLGVGERSADGDDPPHCVWVWNVTGRSRGPTVGVSVDAGVLHRSDTTETAGCE